jgi:DNA helicase II / ATP-dependent DNA helicase PcrA
VCDDLIYPLSKPMPQFDNDQQQVIDAGDGAWCVQAGPGSGKTTVLLGRVEALLEQGVPRREILCVTFTREAADTMVRRSGGSKDAFCTFHSLGYRICTAENGPQPLELELRHRLLIKLCRKYGLEYKVIASFISRCRHNGISPAQAMEENGEWKYGLPKAYNEYETERLKGGWIDFDSMLCDAAALLEDPSIRAHYQVRYPLADEMQDSDHLQWRIMQLLSEKHGNVMVVGDPNQSIYAFRDAHPENLTSFQSWFPNGKYLYLGRNYRSTPVIVDFVRRKAPVNTPMNEKMVAVRTEQGVPIEYRMFSNELDEAESAVATANLDPANSAILARTNRQLAPLENLCLSNNIKYHLLGKSGFWKQTEIGKAIDALKELQQFPLPTAMTLMLNKLEPKYRVEDMTDEDNDALANLQTLRTIAQDGKFSSTNDFLVYANIRRNAPKQRTGLTLSTIHQAKGSEYSNVFVIGVQPNVLPHVKGDPLEERRIFFVAISRPKDRLRLSFVGSPSVFLRPDVTNEMVEQLAAQQRNVERIRRTPEQGRLL